MPEKIEQTEAHGSNRLSLVVYLCGAFLGGFGGNYLLVHNIGPQVLAPDRYTGAQARAASALVTQRLDKIEKHISDLEQTVARLPPRQLTQELALLKQDFAYLRNDFERHEQEHP